MYVLLVLREHVSNSVYMCQSMISWFVLWLALKHVGGIHWNNLPFTCILSGGECLCRGSTSQSGIFHVEKHSYTMRECCCINKYFIPCHSNTVANTRLDVIPWYVQRLSSIVIGCIHGMSTNYAMLSSGIPRNIPWITYMLLVCTRVDTREN